MKNLLLLGLLLCCALPVGATTLIKVVATVNNEAVTSHQLEKRLATAMATDTTKHQLTGEEHKALKLKVLDQMIEELLVEQRVREIGLKVSDEEITRAVEDVQRQNKLTLEQLKTALSAQGMDFAEYRTNLGKEILRYKLIAREVRSKVEVTRNEIRTYFKAHEEEYRQPPTLQLGRISYPLPKDAGPKAKEKLQQKAEVVRQQLLNGKPFTEVLAGLGADAEGGDMGEMIEAEMNSALREAVSGLKAGEVSKPAEAFGSIHIFQVLKRTPARAELTEEISQQIEQTLAQKNSEARFAEWKKELRKGAAIDIRL